MLVSDSVAFSSLTPSNASLIAESEEALDPLMNDNTIDDASIDQFASCHGVHRFPDPDIKGHKIQEEMSINSVHHVFLKKVKYDKKEIYPDWILEVRRV